VLQIRNQAHQEDAQTRKECLSVIERNAASTPALAPTDDLADLNPLTTRTAEAQTEWQARHELAWHRAETERVKVLVEFLARPIHAHGGSDPDPDIVTAYNLAVEAALQGIRRATTDR
jgi:hypothetical protein